MFLVFSISIDSNYYLFDFWFLNCPIFDQGRHFQISVSLDMFQSVSEHLFTFWHKMFQETLCYPYWFLKKSEFETTLFFLTALLRNNSHIILFTHLKYKIQCLIIYSHDCTTTTTMILKHFCNPVRIFIAVSSHSPFPTTSLCPKS